MPLVKYWRGHGLRVIVYFDAGVVAVACKEAACAASKKVQDDLCWAALSPTWPSVHRSQPKNVFG